MSKQTKLLEPWRSIHGAVWLIGIAILFSKGWWWPGILILIAISGVVEAIFRYSVPGAVIDVESEGTLKEDIVQEKAIQLTADAKVTEVRVHRPELLPSTCPTCGAPVSGDEVRWTGTQSADCQYCGANLPMREE